MRSVAASRSKLLVEQLRHGEPVDQSCAILRHDLRGYPVLRKLLHSGHRRMGAVPNELSRRYLEHGSKGRNIPLDVEDSLFPLPAATILDWW